VVSVALADGGVGWISERVIDLDGDPSALPWFGDKGEEHVPLIMDCGTRQPILHVGTFGYVTKNAGLNITEAPGIGKPVIDSVKYNELFKIVDGPFCTKMSTFAYNIEWLVETGKGVKGYVLEGVPQGKTDYEHYTAISKTSDPKAKTDRPEKITDEDIETVSAIFQDVQSYKANKTEVEKRLTAFVEATDKDTLAWIVRRVPVYNVVVDRWQSFVRYANFTAMKWRSNSPLDLDPVATTLDIIYGDYALDPNQFWNMVGCG